jgi:FixJ family two-component response regulator
MPDANSNVLVIDDDADLRASIGRLLQSLGLDVQLFVSIADFLSAKLRDYPTCLVLDVRMPGKSGLDLQRELAAANRELPIIFITGHADILEHFTKRMTRTGFPCRHESDSTIVLEGRPV